MITCKEDLIGKVIRIRSKEDADLVMQVCEKFGVYVGEWPNCSYVPFKSVAAKISHNYSNTYSCKLVFTDSYKEQVDTSKEFKDLSDLSISDLKPKSKQFISKALEDSIKETVSEQFADCIKRTPVFTPCKWDLESQEQEKPRTKVEYEKANFEPEEIWKAFKEHQEVGFLYVKTSDEYECLLDGVFNLAMAISQGDQLYRKVEHPVEWWEDAVEYVRSLNGEANAIDFTDASSDGKKIAMNISVVLDERQAKDFARILLEQEGE